MISACDTQDFVPFGREYSHHHPGTFQLQVKNVPHVDHGLPLLKSFRDISLQDNGKKENWQFHPCQDEEGKDFDEELYHCGNTVIWSRGGQDGARHVVKTFTMETPIVDAVWCQFVLPSSSQQESHINLDAKGVIQKGICVVELTTATFFTEKGKEYTNTLPFQVAHCWIIKNGLLFERSITPSEMTAPRKNAPHQTVVFSILHPLNELAPVITKLTSTSGSPKVSYLTDNTQHIVFSNTDPSIILTYDTMVGVHSVWSVRGASAEECWGLPGMNDTSVAAASFLQQSATPITGFSQNNSNQSRLYCNLSAQSPNVSPCRRLSGRLSSPAAFSRSQSPLIPLGAQYSRTQSPAMSTSALYRFHSPSPARSPANYARTPFGQNNLSLINESFTEWVEPLTPEVCLEHIWTEPIPTIRDGSLGKSSKAFLTEDICKKKYLCYLIPYRNQLRCVRFEESNDLSQLIFGAVTVINAKDAIPIEKENLMVVLEPNGNLFVYTGTTKVNYLHIPTLPLGSASFVTFRPVTPIGSPIRGCDGGIFTSSRPPSAMDARFDEEMSHISPVRTELDDFEKSFADVQLPGNNIIQCLRDNIGSRFTVGLINGNYFRASLPELTKSAGISLCLEALKHMLPRDVTVQVFIRWYTNRNVPGGLGNQSEWSLFRTCLLSLMGYDTSRLALTSKHDLDCSMSPVVTVKKAKQSSDGGEDDWDTLLNSVHHTNTEEVYGNALGLSHCEVIPDRMAYSKPCEINSNSPLFPHIPSTLFALHLIYEELKLDVLLKEEIDELLPLVFQIASDLKMFAYTEYYLRDNPRLYEYVDEMSQISTEHMKKMLYPAFFSQMAPSVNLWLYNTLQGLGAGQMFYIPNVCNNTKNVISLLALLLYKDLPTDQAMERCLRKVIPAGHRPPTGDISMSRSFRSYQIGDPVERSILYMTELGMTQKDLEKLPIGIALPIQEAIFSCRSNPPSDWSKDAYTLIGRQDLSKLIDIQTEKPVPPPGIYTRKNHSSGSMKTVKEDDDGMDHLDEELLRLRFSDDLRIQEVKRLLQSAKPARIALTQRPEVSDHDFIEEKERHLYSICIRTMALPVGRGMFTLSTYHPLPTEAITIPKLCLTGRASPRNTTVDLSHIDTPPNMNAWPLFHNGVAAGLRIANSSQIDSTWIIYNKPKSNELTNEYAGFLMALGLNGHLTHLHTLNVHDYLSKGHEMTTIGLLLGLSAVNKGTMDLATTRVLSIHVTALLPPTSTELNVPHNVQVASVMGIGLVYQGTGHRHTAEVLLSEIGRPPGPEMENCMDRESYSLASGLALGLVMFGKGNEAVNTSELSMADTLYHFMVGGHKRPLGGPNRERYRSPSYQIKEGDSVNVDVTSPGATLALGMLYFNTNNSAVAEWLTAPDTQFMLDHVRPDFLMLRTISRGLIQWESVLPNVQWIQSNIPEIVKKYAFERGCYQDEDTVIDFETMSQAYCNIVAGIALTLGLKFAGSVCETTFKCLNTLMKKALKILSTPDLCEQAGKSTVESCLSVIILSLAMVMAGTGNLEVLRYCRMLRKRVGPQYNYMMYGSHMAISMSVGLLFMGGGRFTLSTKPESIGVMLCSFFPKFPTHSNDNRYHLQAFRHLYVLAAEPRVMLPRDVDTGNPCYVPLEIKYKDTDYYKDISYQASAPSIIPEMHLLKEVKVCGPRYWPIFFHTDKNWNNLKSVLEKNGTLFVKQRAGYLSYVEDPKGYRSMLAKSLTNDQSCHTTVQAEIIKSFTSDPKILAFSDYYLKSQEVKEYVITQLLSSILYECITQEKPEAIPVHIYLDQSIRRCSKVLTSSLWQLKLISSFYNNKKIQDEKTENELIQQEFLLGLHSYLEDVFDEWLNDHLDVLIKYLKKEVSKEDDISLLSAYVTWYDIPCSKELLELFSEGTPSLPHLCSKIPGLKIPTALRLINAWKTLT